MLGLAGCQKNAPTSVAPDRSISVTIYISNVRAGFWEMGACDILQMADSVRDASGAQVTADSVQWSVSDTTEAIVSATGLISTIKPTGADDTLRVTAWHAGVSATARNSFGIENPFDPLPFHPCSVSAYILPSRSMSMFVAEELDIVASRFGPSEFQSPPMVAGSSLTFLGMTYVQNGLQQLFRFKSSRVGQAIITFRGGIPQMADVIDTVNVQVNGASLSRRSR